VIISRAHRNGYDHSIRVAGAKLVDVGMNEQVAAAGVRRTEVCEYEATITDSTIGTHDHGLPVLVNAAAQLPPIFNLQRFIEMGADS
jgi:D-glucosaminate-6-phosphate ammonia-lyase